MEQDQHSGDPKDRPQNPDRTNPEETQEERFEKNRLDIDSTTPGEVSMQDDERTAANGSQDESLAAPNRGSSGSNNALESEVSMQDDERNAANQSDEEIEGNQTSGGLDRDEQRRAAGKGDV
jgi:hypothetical protein